MSHSLLAKAVQICGRSARQRLPREICIELLENRRLLSATLIVTSDNDSGPGSLRDAINQNNNSLGGGDTIRFAPSAFGTIKLTTGELIIAQPLTIAGPGAGLVNISGDGASRVMLIPAVQLPAVQMTVNIFGVTISNGRAAVGGGGILNGGSLILRDVVLLNNKAIGSATDPMNNALGVLGTGSGGAILDLPGSSVTLQSSQLLNNAAIGLNGAAASAQTGPGMGLNVVGGGLGGAIFNLGAALNINNTVFAGNQALGGTGGSINVLPGDAVAVDPTTGLPLPVFNALDDGAGGGIFNTSAGPLLSSATITNSVFAGNQAIGGSDGGAIFPPSPASTLSPYIASGFGGGIENFTGSSATLDHSVVLGNRAIAGNFNSANIPTGNTVNSQFVGSAYGGGIDSEGANGAALAGPLAVGLHITSSWITNNTARGTPFGLGHGGGISIVGQAATIATTLIDFNTAIGPSGAFGGGVALMDGAGAVMTDDLIEANRAICDAALLEFGDALGGGVAVDATSSATFDACEVVFNQALAPAAPSAGIGGGLYTLGTVSIDASTLIIDNFASTAGNNIGP